MRISFQFYAIRNFCQICQKSVLKNSLILSTVSSIHLWSCNGKYPKARYCETWWFTIVFLCNYECQNLILNQISWELCTTTLQNKAKYYTNFTHDLLFTETRYSPFFMNDFRLCTTSRMTNVRRIMNDKTFTSNEISWELQGQILYRILHPTAVP